MVKRLDDLTVFYLDDDPNLLHLVETHLVAQGARVQSFQKTNDALSALEGDPLPDLILCDILLPDMDGHSFHQAVRSNPAWRSIPFIYVTALDQYPEYRRSMNQGADGYLSKPFTKQQLLQEINHVLERFEMLSRHQQIQIKLLGTQQVRQGPELRSAPDRGAEAFVYYLMVQGQDKLHPRVDVVTHLWGEITPSGYRSVLSRSRRWCNDWLDIFTEGDDLRVSLKDQAQCDLYALEAALEADIGGEQLEQLYTGPLLPSYHYDWALQRREELQEQVRARFIKDAGVATTVQERASGLRRALAVDPYDFGLWERYIGALLEAGLHTEAEQARKQQESFVG